MKRHLRSVLAIIFTILLLIVSASAAQAQDVPQLLSHQGRIFDVDNKPIVGLQTLTFRVYDAADDTGTVLWTETIEVALSDGYYSTVLGQTTAIPDTVFNGSTRFLGITVGDDAVTEELAPRLEVTSVAYAIKAGVAENATGALTPESITLGGGGTTLNADGSINAGDAMIGADGTITLGAATINPDGSIEVGNTTIGADGAITVNNTPVIAADGSVSSDSISGTTLADLEAAGCADGQLPRFDVAAGWGCFTPAAGTAYVAGAGLSLDAASAFSVDPTQVQTRVVGSCSTGESIQAINEDGSVICEIDDDSTYTAGAGIEVSSGVISLTDITDDDTQYAAGTALTLDPSTNTFNVDQTQIEAWANAVDSDTTYAPGAGIDIAAGVISLTDAIDDDTTYLAGTGLALDTATNTFNVDQTQIEAWANAVDSDTTYTPGAGIDITAGVVSLTDTTDDDTLAGLGCTTDQLARHNGSAWECVAPAALGLTAADVGALDSGGGSLGGNLMINGSISIGADAGACDPTRAGTLRWQVNELEVCNGAIWTSLVPALGSPSNPAASCLAIKQAGDDTGDAVYTLTTGPAYCEMTTDGGGWTLVAKVEGADDYWQCGNTPGCTGSPWRSTALLNESDLTLSAQDAKYPSYLSLAGSDVMFYDAANSGPLLYVNGAMNNDTFADWVGTFPDPGNSSSCGQEWPVDFVATGYAHPFCQSLDCSTNARLGAFCRDEEAWGTRDFNLFAMPNDNTFDYNFGNKPGLASDRYDGGHSGGTHVDVDAELTGTADARAWTAGAVGVFVR